MNIKFRYLLGIFFIGFLCSFDLNAQITLSVNRANAIYEIGEVLEFDITGNGAASYYILTDTRNEPLYQGVVNVSGSSKILYTPDQPGVYTCRVYANNQIATGSAVVAPSRIARQYPAPSDLMTFWDEQLAALAAVPIDANVNLQEEDDYSKIYKFDLAMIDNRRVYGYMAIPKGNYDTYPAILELPAYSAVPNAITANDVKFFAERGGAIGLMISIHNAPLDVVDPNAYMPNVITNADSIYYKWTMLACVRTLDFINTIPEFDGENMAVTGVSQGGGLAIILAGLDERVNALVYSNPALCANYGKVFNQASGFPYYLHASAGLSGDPEENMNKVLKASSYFDATHFAARFKGPSLGVISYQDTICPANATFTAYNLLKGAKILNHYRNVGHNHPNTYWEGRYDFFRLIYPNMRNPPWPFTDGTQTGFEIEAGANQTLGTGQNLNLEGMVKVHGVVNTSYPVEWTVEEGDGPVNITDFNNRNTTVSFSNPGTYVLKFTAKNEDSLAADSRYVTLVDYITITVQ